MASPSLSSGVQVHFYLPSQKMTNGSWIPSAVPALGIERRDWSYYQSHLWLPQVVMFLPESQGNRIVRDQTHVKNHTNQTTQSQVHLPYMLHFLDSFGLAGMRDLVVAPERLALRKGSGSFGAAERAAIFPFHAKWQGACMKQKHLCHGCCFLSLLFWRSLENNHVFGRWWSIFILYRSVRYTCT